MFAVAAAGGRDLEPFDAFDPAPYAGGDPAEADAATDALVGWLRTQAKDRSGIWRDLAVRRRPTEVPMHYAPVLAEAERLDVPLRLLPALLDQIAELEAGGVMSEERLDRLGGLR